MLEEKKLSKCMYGRDSIHVSNHYHHLAFASLPDKRRWRYSSPSLSSSPSLYGLVGLADRLNNLTYSATKKQKLRELWSEWVNLTLNGIIGVASGRGSELLGRVGVLVPSTYSVHSDPANTMSVVERALVTLGSMSVGIGGSSGGSSGGGSIGGGSSSGGSSGGSIGGSSGGDSGGGGSSRDSGGSGSSGDSSGSSGGSSSGGGGSSGSSGGRSGGNGSREERIRQRRGGCFMGDAIEEGVYHSRRQFFSAFMFLLGEGKVFLRLGGQGDYIERHSVILVRKKKQTKVFDSENEDSES